MYVSYEYKSKYYKLLSEVSDDNNKIDNTTKNIIDNDIKLIKNSY
jgi:hypothetical protein